MSQFAAVMSVFSPGGDDWIVTVATRDGKVANRRISPGTMSETDALRIALRVERIHPDDVADAGVRRVGDRGGVIATADDPFARLVERLRNR